ncbi:MAG: transketolase, partial [Verrucomicrobiae bacterium]|nr:transketolase [Verrucomicrobiae bacterium]
MGEVKSAAKPLAAPPLKPLALKSKLAPTPRQNPRYSVTVRNRAGQPVVLADPRVTRALVALMNTHAIHGGAACHWGGPAAFAEINAAVHGLMFAVPGREWHEAYNYVNDAGHAENGVYALRANHGFDGLSFADLRAFRSVASKLTGHGESHLNPEGVLLSNGPLGSSLPQAQGLALADRVIGNDRVTVAVISDGASMEGEAKEAFAAIPGLAAKGRLNPFVLILSDNDTKLSGRITKDSFSMAPTFAAMGVLGWRVIEVPEGHNLEAVYQAVEQGVEQARADATRPVCLHVKTIKGYGVKATEESSSGGHGFPLKGGHQVGAFVDEIWGGQTPEEFVAWSRELAAAWEAKEAAKKAKPANPDAPKKEKVQSGLARGAIKAALAGHPVFSVSSDVQGSTGVADFQKTFPDRWIEVGVAEANMVSTGAGLAKMGYIPIVDTFAQFGITKGNLPLTMAALSQAPVIGVFSHVGLQDAADGASHQATTYLAATSAIPHTVVIACSCSGEAESLMFQAIERIATERRAGRDGESVVFFVGRENYPQQWVENPAYPWGKAQVVREGTDVVLVGCGTLFGKAVEAGEQLAAEGIQATVINNPF